MNESPEMVVEIIVSGESFGGIGEPVLPTIAQALVNAIRNDCGENITELPIGQA